jgi:hypothetical protein
VARARSNKIASGATRGDLAPKAAARESPGRITSPRNAAAVAASSDRRVIRAVITCLDTNDRPWSRRFRK